MDETTNTSGFITKDSGKRETFESGMKRDTQDGKLRYDLAFDGPLFWALFPDVPLVQAAKRWYENGGIENAAEVVRQLGILEGGLFKLVDRYSALMMRGAIKYDETNWMKAEGSAELKRFRISFCRHLKQYLNQEIDEDHGAALFFNLNGAEYVQAKLNRRLHLWCSGHDKTAAEQIARDYAAANRGLPL